MSVTNERRYALHKRFNEVLGREEAATMMDYLPPVGWADVATKNDLNTLGTGLRSETALLGSELRAEMGDIRAEMGDIRAEMRIGFAEVRAEMHKGQRDLVFAMIASNVSIAGLAVAVSQLL